MRRRARPAAAPRLFSRLLSVAYSQADGSEPAPIPFRSARPQLYTPPGAYVSLRGLSVQGTFLRGVFEKVGIEPQIKRIGKYKSAGDQLGRRDMSDAQREVLNALLKEIFESWVKAVAQGRGKAEADVLALLDDPAGVFDMKKLKERGFITDTKYLVRTDTGGRAPSSDTCRVHLARLWASSTNAAPSPPSARRRVPARTS